MYNSQNKPDIMSMTPEELEGFVESIGEKKFRAAQLFFLDGEGNAD